jgi:hypothetical protein
MVTRLDDFPLIKIRERLRYERCGTRQVVVTFLAPDQMVGGLVQLFDKKPN